MQSNYSRLGDYIRELKVRNTDQRAEKLLGINIDKFFMPSVANVVGTDLSVYKIVKKNQFACNRMHVGRDYRLPISMSKTEEEFIVSPAYDVFEITDTSILLPEFLMMWFTRREFDRNAWFYTDADVRGGLPWKSFCDMQLPLPSITKQKEIVKEYNIIQNRIALNQQLIQKLEEAAHAVYKSWFVEFEFPDENGKPYKNNGGDMIWNEELQKEIPKKWKLELLKNICQVVNGRAYAENEFRESGTPIIRIQNLNGGTTYVYSDLNLDEDKYVEKGDLIFAWSATFGPFIWRGTKSIYHYHIWKLKHHSPELKYLLYIYFLRETKRVSGEGTGSVFAHITKSLMESQQILVPDSVLLGKFHSVAKRFDLLIEDLLIVNHKLTELKELLLSKLATVEN